jgi:Ni/Co efflux regulator RcnB
MHTTSHHTARIMATALAISAVLAPAASAQQDLRSPDTRDAAQRAEQLQDLRMPDTRDAAADRGLERAPVVEFVDVQPADRFDWTDAALGAVTAIGIVLVGTGAAVTTVRVRRRPLGA